MEEDVAGEGRSGLPASAGEPTESELRAKYLEYCSARISEVFLSLSDERTYQLVEEAARDEGVEVGSLGFQAMMRLVTRKLRESVPLPDFESWAREYREDPARFEPLLLGLWREALEERARAAEEDG
ncbi:MAG: hypothetical protein PVJ51_12220 [Acidobacteriota bacterium]